MILQVAEELLQAKPEAARLRVRVGRRGAAPPVLRADGAELGGVSVAAPLDAEGRAALAELEVDCASANWPDGRFLRLEAVDGAGAPLVSRALPAATWTGRAPTRTAERPPWGPAGPRLASAEPAPVGGSWGPAAAPAWPAELMAPPAALEGPGPAALQLALGLAAQGMANTVALSGQLARLAEVALQTAGRTAVEASAQHAQNARASSAQLGALSGQVAQVAERAAERAELEAERSAAAVEAAAAADKASALAELSAKMAGEAGAEGGLPPGGAQLVQLGLSLLASGARPVVHRPAAAGQTAPAPQLEETAPDPGAWVDRVVAALSDAQADPDAGARLEALGAALPPAVRASLAAGAARAG